MNQAKRIVTNLFSLSAGEAISKALMFFIFIYLARVLGPENFGKFGFVISFIGVFYMTTQLGLDTFGAREIAKNQSKAGHYLNSILSIKTILGVINFAVLVMIVFFLPKDLDVKYMLLIYGLSIFSNAFLIEFYFQGKEKMEYLGIGKILRALTFVILALIFVKEPTHILIAPLVYVVGHFAANVFLFFIGFREQKFRFNISPFKKYLKVSVIMGLGFFFSSINFQIDRIILGFFDTFTNLGFYEAAVKVIYLFFISEAILWSAFLPIITKSYSEKRYFSKRFHYYSKITLFIGFFVFGFTFIFSDLIVSMLYGQDYLVAQSILRGLSFTVLLQFMKGLFVLPLIAVNKEKDFLKVIMFGAIVNVILNLILIPIYGITGAIVTANISNLVIVVFGYIIIRKELEIRYSMFLKYMLAIIVPIGLIYFLRLNYIFSAIVFVFGYFVILIASREISVQDLKYLINLFSGVNK